jgi:hypothetical protein
MFLVLTYLCRSSGLEGMGDRKAEGAGEPVSFRLMNKTAALENVFSQKILLIPYLTTKNSRDLPNSSHLQKCLQHKIISNIGRDAFMTH